MILNQFHPHLLNFKEIQQLSESTVWSCCEHVCDIIHPQTVIVACRHYIFSSRGEKGTCEALWVHQITNRIGRLLIYIPPIPNLHFTVKLIIYCISTTEEQRENKHLKHNILSSDRVTINDVWIGNWIYCTLTIRKYK
jgi:hypothetical protein